jgi:hypothetical protein
MSFFLAIFGASDNYTEIKSKSLDFRLEKVRMVTNGNSDSKNITLCNYSARCQIIYRHVTPNSVAAICQRN